MGQVGEDCGIGFENVGEVQMVRLIGREAAVTDDGCGRVGCGQEVALEALHGFEQASDFVSGQGIFDDDIAVDFEVVALGWSQGRERADEFGGGHGG